MEVKIPPPFLKELRHLLASAIADFKAYDVPSLCARLGLADGTEEEAFQSKYKYASSRIASATPDHVFHIANQLLVEHDNFWLNEQVTKINELNAPHLSPLTRRKIISCLSEQGLSLDIPEIEILSRIWPIDGINAPDYSRENTMRDYLARHTVSFHDLSTKDVLEELGLLTCSNALVFRLIEQCVSPETRSPEAQKEIVEELDALLRPDGYTLVPTGKMSGYPLYGVKELQLGTPSDAAISQALAGFDPEQVHARWEAAIERRKYDPSGAITLARTLLEDVCKWILDEAGQHWDEQDDLPKLYRKLAKKLKLAPDDHTEKVFKQILGSCQSVVESLGSLRNKLGDAHSSGPKRSRPQQRHAHLAVNLAGAMATFLVETWKARKEQK